MSRRNAPTRYRRAAKPDAEYYWQEHPDRRVPVKKRWWVSVEMVEAMRSEAAERGVSLSALLEETILTAAASGMGRALGRGEYAHPKGICRMRYFPTVTLHPSTLRTIDTLSRLYDVSRNEIVRASWRYLHGRTARIRWDISFYPPFLAVLGVL